MKILILIKQSLGSLLRNKVRSFLTIIGVVIGIGSVIALMALGNGVTASVSGEISSLGSNNLTIVSKDSVPGGFLGDESSSDNSTEAGAPAFPTSPGRGSISLVLTTRDLQVLEQSVDPAIVTAAGQVSAAAIAQVGDVVSRQSLTGISPKYLEVNKLDLQSGIGFDDTNRTDKVIILGDTTASSLFPNTSPIGQTMLLNGETYTIIGVVEKQSSGLFGVDDTNTSIFVTDYTAQQLASTDFYTSLTVIAGEDIELTRSKVIELLMSNRGITDKSLVDFAIISADQLLSTVSTITNLLTSLLAGIAAISLLVGGIGIMNIMLVSVTERTKEIGLRKAVGASISDIMLQFLIEAVTITVIGGILGIVLGFVISQVAGSALGFTAIVTADAILLAVSVSSIIGIVFGIYPAAKAARLNPIDALRYE